MTTYSILTPTLQAAETGTDDVLGRFIAGGYAYAGTLTPTGVLSEWVLPGRLCVEHEHGSIYETTDDRMRFAGTLFEALGYRELTGLNLFNRKVGIRIRALQPQAVSHCLNKAAGVRITSDAFEASPDGTVTVFLNHPELVQFVVLLHAAASFTQRQDRELGKPPIPLSQAYAAIGYDAEARPGVTP
jgi:hypothetical protein